ncbi:MAG: hypothetical protein U0Q15_16425 [Kineosporiaceae bacterium]
MDNATGSPRDAASVLFDLPGYRVVSAVDLPGGGREVVIASVEGEAGCPTCGVLGAGPSTDPDNGCATFRPPATYGWS